MDRTTVHRAYRFVDGTPAVRTLVNSRGEVYEPQARTWTSPMGHVLLVPGKFERWVDVPESWLGHLPWWR
jgi:hypothetical protein